MDLHAASLPSTSASPGRRRVVLSAAALGTAALLCAPRLRAQGRPEKTRVVVAVNPRTPFQSLPLTAAEQLGYFRSEGLSVVLVDIAGNGRGPDWVQGGGQADMVSGAYEDTIALQGRGLVVQSVVLQGRAPQVAVGVSVRNLPDYRRLTDLRGHRVGVPGPGPSARLTANLLLSRAGLRPGEVSLVPFDDPAQALVALRAGDIEAISSLDPLMTLLEQNGEARIVSDTRTLKGTAEVFGGPMPGACVYAPLAFVQKNPGVCQAMANAVVRTLKWLQTAGPGDLLETVSAGHAIDDRALYLASFSRVREAIAVDGVVTSEGPLTALRAVSAVQPGLDPDAIDLAKTFTNEFARRAKERFRV